MSRLLLLLVLTLHGTSTAEQSLLRTISRLYHKLEAVTAPPAPTDVIDDLTAEEKLYEKLARLDALAPEREFSDEEEELVAALQQLGGADLPPEEVYEAVRELHARREDEDNILDDYPEEDDEDDYQDDFEMEEDAEEATSKPIVHRIGLSPSAITKLGTEPEAYVLDPIAATEERPRVMEFGHFNKAEQETLKATLRDNLMSTSRARQCSRPLPRWLLLRRLVPAADSVYFPSCVRLMRCAPDSACCLEDEVLVPTDGRYEHYPVYRNHGRSTGLQKVVMILFNHTECRCMRPEEVRNLTLTRQALRQKQLATTTISTSTATVTEQAATTEKEVSRQNDWRPAEEPRTEKEEEPTSAPMRRCTCPALFMSQASQGGCSCVCAWPDFARRRDCAQAARGREHLGMRDRVCIDRGDCTAPTCQYGPYERSAGRCPPRRYRRIHYRRRRT